MPFHGLNGFSSIEEEFVRNLRTRAVLRAIEKTRDFRLLEVLQRNDQGQWHEVLVVDVECDGVPPKNPFGIRYRERLALDVSSDEKSLIEVYALRKDFPVLMHQNMVPAGAPASLCLYFEAVASVHRTWTPEKFLRRIQWWLEKSATGELHPSDQQVEHLFFATKYELVLPWNLEDLREAGNHNFEVVRADSRPNKGLTCFLLPTSRGEKRERTTFHIEIEMPPIVHGEIERDPSTLEELVDLFERRDAELLPKLCNAIQAAVGENGVHESKDNKNVILLISIPIARSKDQQPELTTHRAFLVPIGSLALGAAIGALFKLEGTYHRVVLIGQTKLESAKQSISPMQVLKINDSAASRRQSGICESGPEGMLIGAGSLGSAMLNLWARSGWGNWVVVDVDHIKPHNLSRHIAHVHNVGEPKATATTSLIEAATHGAIGITPLIHDATDFENSEFLECCSRTDLVVDASTTLEYPRRASLRDDVPRHVSAFITPNGEGAVLLVEDAARSHRLVTLEAQYYRGIIGEEWGRDHLAGSLRTFWSGASCRDISMVMPYSRVMNHASTLAEQIQVVVSQDQSVIRVWCRDSSNGAVEVHDVPVNVPKTQDLDDLTIHFDNGLIEFIQQQRLNHLPNETGGVLLGYYDLSLAAVVVAAALPAPPDSISSARSFQRGTEGLIDQVELASELTSGVVGYIGEWHSHPVGVSASLSSDDLTQLQYLASGMAADGLPAISLIVSDREVEFYKGSCLD